ncbi:hypothetical protein [Empedobacter brevis]|uniref:hypothetical protein n=1 Tax=Empedobacter brevis TaxID=247 RepID=UPI002FE37CE3
MDIKYMTEIKKNMKIPRKPWPNEGLSVAEIEKLELKYNQGKEFPRAFREFLFLAGENNNFAFDDLGEGIDELQNIAQEDIDFAGQQLDRPFFAFKVYDSQYSVILLDEIDEDPKVYKLCPFLAKGGSEPLLRIPKGGFKENYTFTELVNESIRRVKNNIAF